MKKLSVLLSGFILVAGISFASPVLMQQKAEKKADKKEVKKVPSKKKADKKDDKKTK